MQPIDFIFLESLFGKPNIASHKKQMQKFTKRKPPAAKNSYLNISWLRITPRWTEYKPII